MWTTKWAGRCRKEQPKSSSPSWSKFHLGSQIFELQSLSYQTYTYIFRDSGISSLISDGGCTKNRGIYHGSPAFDMFLHKVCPVNMQITLHLRESNNKRPNSHENHTKRPGISPTIASFRHRKGDNRLPQSTHIQCRRASNICLS